MHIFAKYIPFGGLSFCTTVIPLCDMFHDAEVSEVHVWGQCNSGSVLKFALVPALQIEHSTTNKMHLSILDAYSLLYMSLHSCCWIENKVKFRSHVMCVWLNAQSNDKKVQMSNQAAQIGCKAMLLSRTTLWGKLYVCSSSHQMPIGTRLCFIVQEANQTQTFCEHIFLHGTGQQSQGYWNDKITGEQLCQHCPQATLEQKDILKYSPF